LTDVSSSLIKSKTAQKVPYSASKMEKKVFDPALLKSQKSYKAFQKEISNQSYHVLTNSIVDRFRKIWKNNSSAPPYHSKWYQFKLTLVQR
jgi:hypothetical protein